MSEGKINSHIKTALETAREATGDSEERLSIAAAILTKKLRNETKFSVIRALLKFAVPGDTSGGKRGSPKNEGENPQDIEPASNTEPPADNPMFKAALVRRDQFAKPHPPPGPGGIPKVPAKSVPAWHVPHRKRHPDSEE
ncbi:MAG: hypothetical protein WC764_04625 [Candidatus Paceibacterota bacterium]